MEKPIKQRIVGITVVVILLAVILLLLFVGSQKSTPITDSNNANQPTAIVSTAQTIWTVQIGSFTTKAHATTLVKKLQQAGFNSYLNEIVTSTKTFYRVFVGTETDQQKADDLRQKLQDNFQL